MPRRPADVDPERLLEHSRLAEQTEQGCGSLDIDNAMAVNRANWDSRVPIHLQPDGYDIDSLVKDPAALSSVVRFDLERLGDVAGLDVVHLQCHIGTDTVSLSRLGAKVVGLDFSGEAIVAARDIASRCGTDTHFVEANVYDAVEAFGQRGQRFDLVYTGIGALGWLPDIDRWARVVARLLKPGGMLHLYELHPMLGTIADEVTPEGLAGLALAYPYFRHSEPLYFDEDTTYAGKGKIASPGSFEWTWNVGDVVQAVIDAGLRVTLLKEHDSLPWKAEEWFEPLEGVPGIYTLPGALRRQFPVSYCLRAQLDGELEAN